LRNARGCPSHPRSEGHAHCSRRSGLSERGVILKNPVLSEEQHEDLKNRAAARGLNVPSYPALETRKKVSAAWLVEHSGFAKGFGSERVRISTKHALAIVNRGGATATDVLALKEQIQHRVQEIWGIGLEPEPVLLGF